MTVRAASGETYRRLGVAGVIVGLHIAVAVLLIQPRLKTRPVAARAMMIVVAVPATAAPPAVREAPLDVGLRAPAVDVAPSMPQATSCDVLGTLGTALQADAAARAALSSTAAMPQHGIMVWNGRWSEQAEAQPLRRTIIVNLTIIQGDCLDEVLVGPRLIFLDTEQTIVSVALGSGSWHWRDLLSSD